MLHISRALAALSLLAFVASLAPVSGQDKEGDFPKWNTWKVAKKGDWVEYTLSFGPKVRFEVLNEPGGGKVKYKHQMFDAAGKETSSKEFEKDWNAIRLQATPSPRAEVTWREAETELCGHKLKCKIASWQVGKVVDEVWYSVDVPCGGVVKQTSDGKDTVIMTGFKSAKAEGGATGDKPTGDKPATDAKLPSFLAKVGNTAVYKVTAPTGVSYLRREVTAVEGDTATMEQALCDATGVVAEGAKVNESKVSAAKWAEDYPEASEKGVTIKLGAVEYKCDKFVKESTSMTTTTWISEGVIVKVHVKRDMGPDKPGVETTMELATLTMK